MTPDPRAALEHAEVLAEVAELRSLIESQARDTHAILDLLRPGLARLLPAIHAVLGEDEFAAAWLVHASVDVVPGARELRAALLAVIGREPEEGVHRLGKFLSRHAGAVVGEYRLDRVRERTRDGVIMKVTKLTSTST